MQEKLLDLYTDYLISSFGQVTATGLSRVLDGEVSHDQITRFLSSEEKRSADLRRIAKPLVRQIESDSGVIVIDDTIEEKQFTDENELICWHWDHSKQRNVKGINFLSALYVTDQGALPVAFDLVTKVEAYVDEKTGNLKRRSSISKNERYRMLLRVVVHNQIKFRYVINDSWYASSDNMKIIKRDLHKEFVMPLKSNRKVALSQAEKARGQYQAVSQLELPLDATREVWLEEVPFALLLTKQVFTNEDGSTGVLYLVTSDMTLPCDRIQQLYQKRWRVEEYHKSLKQNVSLEKSPTRTTTTQRNHLFSSLCAYLKLESLKWQTKLNHFALKSKIYSSALKAAYSELVKLSPQPLAA
ncbi:MAG TPA: transposase [Pyrinomonadaceae bacterium]